MLTSRAHAEARAAGLARTRRSLQFQTVHVMSERQIYQRAEKAPAAVQWQCDIYAAPHLVRGAPGPSAS